MVSQLPLPFSDQAYHGPFPFLSFRLAGEPPPRLALPWVVKLRYGAVLGQVATILFVTAVLGVGLPLRWLAIPLAITAISNLLVSRHGAALAVNPQHLLGVLFCVDTLSLTGMLLLTGGPMNPFSLLYLVQITLSAMILNKSWTWVLGALSTLCFGLLFWKYRPLPMLEPHGDQSFLAHVPWVLRRVGALHLVGMWVAFTLAALLITYFIGNVSEILRRREQEALALQRQMAKNERLASLATLAAGAAHELGTPLSTIAVIAKDLERSAKSVMQDSGLIKDSQLIRSEVERCKLILQQMRARGAETVGESPVRILLTELLTRVLDQFPGNQRPLLNAQAPSDAFPVLLPVQGTVQALVALAKNALDANVENRPILIQAERIPDRIRFTVTDRGEGMTAEVLDRIAEPFFTTKPAGRGMGLGAFLVRMFAERLGGQLSFLSKPGAGTIALLDLPPLESR